MSQHHDRHISISGGWVAAGGLGLMSMTAPQYIQMGPMAIAIGFWVGAALFGSTILHLFWVAWHERGKPAVNGPYLLMLFAVFLLLCGLVWQYHVNTRAGSIIETAVISPASNESTDKDQTSAPPRIENHVETVSKDDALDILKKLHNIFNLVNDIKEKSLLKLEKEIQNPQPNEVFFDLFEFLEVNKNLKKATVEDYQSKHLEGLLINDDIVRQISEDFNRYMMTKNVVGPSTYGAAKRLSPDNFANRNALEEDRKRLVESISSIMKNIEKKKDTMEGIISRN